MQKKSLNSLARWLHAYLSMFSFAALLFFAFTGITLNHPEWINGMEKVNRLSGKIDTSVIKTGDSADYSRDCIVELIRKTHGIKARLTDFRIDDYECSFSFSGPGYNADGFIDRSTGSYEITVTSSGILGVLNDLHKGSYTGNHWKWVIDITAAVLIIVSVTGFIMIFFISKRKKPGFIVALSGIIIFIILCYLCL